MDIVDIVPNDEKTSVGPSGQALARLSTAITAIS
jgi:hypothetical protein